MSFITNIRRLRQAESNPDHFLVKTVYINIQNDKNKNIEKETMKNEDDIDRTKN